MSQGEEEKKLIPVSHPIEDIPCCRNPKAIELKPNPFYRPPNKHDEVPQRLGAVKAPPVYLYGRNPEDSALELRWAFRKLFEKKIQRALAQTVASAAKKWQRADTTVPETKKPKKRAKSNSNRGGDGLEAESGQDPAAPPVPPASSEPKLDMTWLRRCKQAEECDDASGASGTREDTTAPHPTQQPLDSSSEASSHQRKVLGLPPREADRADADPLSGEVAERSPLQEGTAPVALPEPIQEI